MKGKIKKLKEQWYVMTVEECDWITYYPIHNPGKHLEESSDGEQVEFEIADEFTHPHLYHGVSWGDGEKKAIIINNK